MGFEGANVIFDTWVHPLMMGLEEHLLAMFKDDFEFKDGAVPSHLGVGQAAPSDPAAAVAAAAAPAEAKDIEAKDIESKEIESKEISVVWAADAEQELRKIPFFVRGKARRNTERFANENGVATITVETLYDAKAHFAR
jgi:light-independent protochlorophyllide reductase subunit B